MKSVLPLNGCTVGISISESEDLDQLGIDRSEVNRFSMRLAEKLLQAGARLAFGHDWRPGGVMEAVAPLALQYFKLRREGGDAPVEPLIINRVAAPDKPFYSPQDESSDGRLLAQIVDARQVTVPQNDRGAALSELRRELASICDARICLGGRLNDYAGRAPGVIEEAAYSIQAGKPVFAGALFGGSARVIAAAMRSRSVRELGELFSNRLMETAAWEMLQAIATASPIPEQALTWDAGSIDQFMDLCLKGLSDYFGRIPRRDK